LDWEDAYPLARIWGPREQYGDASIHSVAAAAETGATVEIQC
jgi:hypothetical protein